MLSNKNTKNANFLFIVDMLKDLLAQEMITEKGGDVLCRLSRQSS